MKSTFHFTGFSVLLALIFGTSTGANAQTNPDRWNTDGNLGDTTKFLGTTDSEPVLFRTDNQERMCITANGRVGINVKKPQARLDVKGNVQFRNDLLLPGLPFALPTDGVLFIDSAGQVKKGDGNTLSNLLYGDKGCSAAFVQAPTWANGPGKIYVNCPEVNVGINTDQPLHRLDVRGNSYLLGAMGVGVEPNLSNIQLNVKTQANRGVGLCLDHQVYTPFSYGYKIIVHDETTKGFAMYSDLYDKEVFMIRSDGQMIISNGQQKNLQLEPNGLLRGRQIKLDLDNWADYVFDEDYSLMPLEEVEAFVKENHHLPNVPSESELIEDGLDLEEMNRLLMEKVEELTLYLIEQHKKIEGLQEKVIELESSK